MTNDDGVRLQDLVAGAWWEVAKPAKLEAGRLARTFVPYPDVATFGLILEGRESPQDHSTARYRVEPIRAGRPSKPPELPVAALPTFPGESFIAQRGKQRPVVVLGTGGSEIERSIFRGGAGYQRKSCVLVLPYYGTEKDGSRGGYPEQLLERVRRAEYPQMMVDRLPIGGNRESLLRFDHVLAVGTAASNFELTDYRLSEEPIALMREWFRWLVEGTIPVDGLLEVARGLFPQN